MDIRKPGRPRMVEPAEIQKTYHPAIPARTAYHAYYCWAGNGCITLKEVERICRVARDTGIPSDAFIIWGSDGLQFTWSREA